VYLLDCLIAVVFGDKYRDIAALFALRFFFLWLFRRIKAGLFLSLSPRYSCVVALSLLSFFTIYYFFSLSFAFLCGLVV
jgi:hypothetical protein